MNLLQRVLDYLSSQGVGRDQLYKFFANEELLREALLAVGEHADSSVIRQLQREFQAMSIPKRSTWRQAFEVVPEPLPSQEEPLVSEERLEEINDKLRDLDSQPRLWMHSLSNIYYRREQIRADVARAKAWWIKTCDEALDLLGDLQ